MIPVNKPCSYGWQGFLFSCRSEVVSYWLSVPGRSISYVPAFPLTDNCQLPAPVYGTIYLKMYEW